MNLTVTRAGFLMTVQDFGRVGSRRFGVSLGGALDAHALRVANFLSGNDEGAAGLELTSGTARLQFRDERIIAWCGGEYEVIVAARSIPAGHSVLVSSNEELIISGPHRGCRAWLAISGGIEVPVVLGSRSTDLRGNFGGFEGRALRDGDELRLGEKSSTAKSLVDSLREGRVSDWSASAEWTATAKDEATLRIIRGADWSRFTDVAIQRFTNEAFIVSPDSDRMGARLEGPELKRSENFDLISEGVAPGTIQIPPNGRPIVLLQDCQTIGGYPKIAHVLTVDLPIAAQLCPRDRVRFVEVSIADAHRLLLEREGEVERFRVGLSLHVS
jgi:antagonist of KipI